MGIHCVTGAKVAVKIINRERLSDTVLRKVEREIAIMKLIEHPHVLALHDVYENKRFLYLVLEHVSGGELFDYLVKKGRLTPKEARKFFRQIVLAVDFCHNHLICHRDLKPENLLLDDFGSIKVADFGMASLQPEGSLLATSCGSPHYACPEVIRGERYDGRKADVWSCGVILYALLVGSLPFDDDNLHTLLEKVKCGVFNLPPFLTHDACDLIQGMVQVDQHKRLTMAQVLKHPWMVLASLGSAPELACPQVIGTRPLNEHELDADVVATMSSLLCFSDRAKLLAELSCDRHNTEKVVYFLLLDRKLRRPCQDDPDEFRRKTPRISDPPKKRVDQRPVTRELLDSSPMILRKERAHQDLRRNRSVSHAAEPHYSPESSRRSSSRGPLRSTGDSPEHVQVDHNGATVRTARDNDRLLCSTDAGKQSASAHDSAAFVSNDSVRLNPLIDNSPRDDAVRNENVLKQSVHNRIDDRLNTTKEARRLAAECASRDVSRVLSVDSATANVKHTSPAKDWRSKLNNFRSSVMGTPRFHRRNRPTNDSVLLQDRDLSATRNLRDNTELDRGYYMTTETPRRSWFPLLKNDEHHIVVIKDRPLNRVRADLVEAFFRTRDLLHTPLSATAFRVEYRRLTDTSVISRSVRFQVDIIKAQSDSAPQRELHCIDFLLLSGSCRQFKRIVDTIQGFLEPSQSSAATLGSDSRTAYTSVQHTSDSLNDHFSRTNAISRPIATNRISPVHGYNDTRAFQSRTPNLSSSFKVNSTRRAIANDDSRFGSPLKLRAQLSAVCSSGVDVLKLYATPTFPRKNA